MAISVEQELRKRVVEFYRAIQGTDSPIVYELSPEGCFRILEWYNKFQGGKSHFNDGTTLRHYARSLFMFTILNMNVFPRRRGNQYIDEAFDLEDTGVEPFSLDIGKCFIEYEIDKEELWKIPFASLVFIQFNTDMEARYHSPWSLFNLVREWEKTCRLSREYYIDEDGFYRGENDLQLELPSGFFPSERIRQMFNRYGLTGFYDAIGKCQSLLFTRNLNELNAPDGLCFSGQKGLLQVPEYVCLQSSTSEGNPFPNSRFEYEG